MPRPLYFIWSTLLGLVLALTAQAAPTITRCEVGFAGAYKLGLAAPVAVEVDDAQGLTVQVVAPDNDGSPVTYSGGVVSAGGQQTVRLLTRVGRSGAPIIVRLMDGGRVAHELEFNVDAQGDSLRTGLSPTSRLLVEVTSQKSLLLGAADSDATTAVVPRLADLPAGWQGYEAADRLMISLSDADVLEGLSDNPAVAEAIAAWVEAGGRLVLVGAAAAEQALGDKGPLRDLAPGGFDKLVPLPDPSPIERYASANEPIGGGRRLAIPVARLSAVDGRIEAYAGGRPEELPLVIRQPRGLGEVVFVAFDLRSGPLADWKATPELVARVAGIESNRGAPVGRSSGALVTAGYTDLSGALQQRLGSRFTGVANVSMLTIVTVAIFYLLLIGPIDYFLLNRSPGRFAAAWVTFPAIVLLFAGAAWLVAGRLGGGESRVNTVELVDFDTASGVVRGTLWAQAYSPTAARHEVSLEARLPSGGKVADADSQVTWLGLPGRGLGGLERSATTLAAEGAAYEQTDEKLLGLPIGVRSTKSLLARWTTRLPAGGAESIGSQLTSLDVGLLDGVVVNNTGAKLLGCWLVHGEWAWRLGDLPAGGAISLGEARAPIKLTTLVQRDYLTAPGATTRGRPADIGDLGADGLLALMMFTRALGPRLTVLGNDFQSFTDLSPAIEQGRAVLVATAAARKSDLLSNGQPWAESTEEDRVYYRFVMPVDGQR